MMWLLSGAYTGDFENYVVYIHPLLSGTLSCLYTQVGNLPWYSVSMFAALYAAFCMLDYQLIAKEPSLAWKYSCRVVLLAILIHLAAFPQFTLVSGFLSLASITLIFNPSLRRSPKLNVLAWGGVFLAMAIRLEAFVLVFAGFLLFYLFTTDVGRVLIFKFGLVGLMFLGLYSSKLLFEHNPNLSGYLAFNKARHEVIDHPVFYELSVGDALREDEKWFYFSQWFFQESEVTLEDLSQKEVELDQAYWSWDSLQKSLLRYWNVQKHELFKGFLSLVFILLLLKYSTVRKKLLWPMVIWGLFFLFANHIFHFRGRVVFLFYLILLIPVLHHSLRGISLKMAYILSSLIFIFTLVHLGNVLLEAGRRKKMLIEFHELEKSVNPNEMFFTEGLPLEYFSKEFDAKRLVPFLINGWVSRSPFQQKAMQRLGFSSYRGSEYFAILQVKEDESNNLSAYLEHLGHRLVLTDSLETAHLVLLKYQSMPTD